MTDNTQVGLKELCEAFIDGDISAGQFKRAVRIWHNKQVEAVLDRLESNKETLYWWTGVEYDKTTAIDMRAIAVERKKLKEKYNG